MAPIKWKIIVPIGIIALIAIFVGYYQFVAKTPQDVVEQTPSGQEQNQVVSEVAPPAATGNIDDVVASLILESSNETSAFQEESEDAALIAADSQAIGDFGQSYDENEF